jgi:hypothetical protein
MRPGGRSRRAPASEAATSTGSPCSGEGGTVTIRMSPRVVRRAVELAIVFVAKALSGAGGQPLGNCSLGRSRRCCLLKGAHECELRAASGGKAGVGDPDLFDESVTHLEHDGGGSGPGEVPLVEPDPEEVCSDGISEVFVGVARVLR